MLIYDLVKTAKGWVQRETTGDGRMWGGWADRQMGIGRKRKRKNRSRGF